MGERAVVIEHVVTFGQHACLVGVRTLGARPDSPATVLANSGVVHRVGANRITVLLARALASAGIESLRFDMSGLGDSTERDDDLGWEASAPLELAEAVDLLTGDAPGRDVLLYGNCGGAAKSLWTAMRDTRVTGLFLTNPPPHPSEGEGDGIAADRAGTRIAADIASLLDRGVRATFLYADGDPGLHYFNRRLAHPLACHLESQRLTVEVVPASNHTFALGHAQEAVIAAGLAFVASFGTQGVAM